MKSQNTYNYDVGYSTQEESHYWQFQHEKKFTHKKLANIVADCLYKVIEYMVDEVECYCGYNGKGPTFENVFECPGKDHIKKTVFVEEMKKKGFKLLEFEARIDVYGWSSVRQLDDWHRDGFPEKQIREEISLKLKENNILLSKQRLIKVEKVRKAK